MKFQNQKYCHNAATMSETKEADKKYWKSPPPYLLRDTRKGWLGMRSGRIMRRISWFVSLSLGTAAKRQPTSFDFYTEESGTERLAK